MLKDPAGGKYYNHTLGVPIVFSVTGHVDVPEGQVPFVIQRMEALFRSFRHLYPHTELILLSGMAEGADRIAARTAIKCGVHVGPVLPRAPADYARSFRGIGYGGDVQASERDFNELLSHDMVYSPCVLPVPSSKDNTYRNLGAYLISNSHVIIAVWDGNTYSEGNGGTYDTVRMAYEGIDNDLHSVAQPMSPDSRYRDATSVRYLNVAEDCLIYWIQTERTIDQKVLDSRGFSRGPGYCGASGFIPPKMMEGEVSKSQNYRPSFLRRVISDDGEDRAARIAGSGMPETSLESALMVRLGSSSVNAGEYRTIPIFYDRLFNNIDGFNTDAGSTGGGYRPGSPMDPDVVRSADRWSSRAHMMPDKYTRSGQQLPVPGSDEIKRNGLMDAMAMRYCLASSMANDFQKRSNRTIWWIILISAATAFCFHLFIMSNTAAFLVFSYGVLLVLEKVLNLKHLNSAEYRKHVEYRCVAETTRVNYYWGLMGINDSAYASCYGFIRNETLWVRSVLLSWSSYFMNDYDMSSVSCRDRRQAVITAWTDNQLSYHEKKRKDNSRLFERYDRMNNAIVALLLILSVVMAVGTVFYFDAFCQPIRVYEVHVIGDEFIDEGNMEITLTSIVKLAMIFLTLSVAYVCARRDTVSGGTPEQIDANIKVFELTRLRAKRIRTDANKYMERIRQKYPEGPEREELLDRLEDERDRCLMHLVHELGSQCIDENNDWVFNTKTKDVSTLGRQEEMTEIAKD